MRRFNIFLSIFSFNSHPLASCILFNYTLLPDVIKGFIAQGVQGELSLIYQHGCHHIDRDLTSVTVQTFPRDSVFQLPQSLSLLRSSSLDHLKN